MRQRAVVIIFLVSFITVVSGAQPSDVRTPNALYAAHAEQRTPLFLAATAAFDRVGDPTPLLPNGWRLEHERVRGMQSAMHAHGTGATASATHTDGSGCDVRQEGPDVEYPVRDSIASTIDNATAIFEGTISEVNPGFFYGHPASLIRVTAVATLKKSPEYARVTDTLYARYPLAVFSAGNVQYCAGLGIPQPAIGAKVLILAFGRPIDETGQLVFSFKNDMLVQTAEGVAFPPLLDVFRTAGARTLDEVAARISADLNRHRRPGEVR